MNREQAYDEKISPLMTQIIEACRAADIPLLAVFQINDERPGAEAFFCTTAIVPDDADRDLKRAMACVRPGPPPMIAVSTRDGAGNLLSHTIIVGGDE